MGAELGVRHRRNFFVSLRRIVVGLYMSKSDHEMVVKECNNLLSKYPKYEGRDRVEQIKRNSEIELEKMGGGGE